MKRYKLIDTEGNITYKDSMTLKEMQDFVEGYIEIVGDIICNEDGLLLQLPKNKVYPRFVGNIIINQTPMPL